MNLKINGLDVEIIEIFGDNVLIQFTVSKNIETVNFFDFDADPKMLYNNLETNVISMSYWKELWQQKKKRSELLEAGKKAKSRASKKHKRPDLKILN